LLTSLCPPQLHYLNVMVVKVISVWSWGSNSSYAWRCLASSLLVSSYLLLFSSEKWFWF
jgi:hypothetical protein